MMNIKLALFISVSAYALQMNPVYASLLSSPPASILDTNIHTTTLQSSAPASFSSVILGLDPRIQVKQGFLSHLDASVKHWHDSSFLTASVCFITDTGACSGNSFNSGANTEDGGHGAPGGGSGDNDNDGKDPDYELNNAERCKKEGYTLTSCNSVQDSVNHCPYDNSYFEKCVCKSGLVTCTKPQYGVAMCAAGSMPPAKLTIPEPVKKTVIPTPVLRDRNCAKTGVANMTVPLGYAVQNPVQPTQRLPVPELMPEMTDVDTPANNAA